MSDTIGSHSTAVRIIIGISAGRFLPGISVVDIGIYFAAVPITIIMQFEYYQVFISIGLADIELPTYKLYVSRPARQESDVIFMGTAEETASGSLPIVFRLLCAG